MSGVCVCVFTRVRMCMLVRVRMHENSPRAKMNPTSLMLQALL